MELIIVSILILIIILVVVYFEESNKIKKFTGKSLWELWFPPYIKRSSEVKYKEIDEETILRSLRKLDLKDGDLILCDDPDLFKNVQHMAGIDQLRTFPNVSFFFSKDIESLKQIKGYRVIREKDTEIWFNVCHKKGSNSFDFTFTKDSEIKNSEVGTLIFIPGEREYDNIKRLFKTTSK